MGVPEIILIVACSGLVISVIITAIIRKKKGKNSCGCDCSSCGCCSSCKSRNKEK